MLLVQILISGLTKAEALIDSSEIFYFLDSMAIFSNQKLKTRKAISPITSPVDPIAFPQPVFILDIKETGFPEESFPILVPIKMATKIPVSAPPAINPELKSASYRDWETDRKSTRLNSSHRL